MNQNSEISFELLNDSHYILIHKWFNQPHVQTFYSLRTWTMEDVRKKLTPRIHGEKNIKSYIIYYTHHPIGYIQSYPIKEHPWENQDLSDTVIQEAAGLDLFIGEKEYLRKGLGSDILNCFLEKHIGPCYRYCLADPDIRNEASLRLFQKCGFKKHKQIFYTDAIKRQVTLQLLIKERNGDIKK